MVKSIFRKTENIAFFDKKKKDIWFHKVIGNITFNSYLHFILVRNFALKC
nr:Uncharacterised protein [Escherichia coli]